MSAGATTDGELLSSLDAFDRAFTEGDGDAFRRFFVEDSRLLIH